ncbi:MAG: S9 family peptidase [Candidatus Eremiobacteraeota bacterium]|nr:S9 family peptidase [Candidatus Eremiobacteraeota bacterium]
MRALALAALLCVVVLVPNVARGRTIQVADARYIVGVSDPAIAPDGTKIACVVTRSEYKTNSYDSDIVLVDIASGAQRVLTRDREDVSAPRWSPTGHRLAFIARDGEGKTAEDQVYVMPMSGGDARKVTAAPNGVEVFAWRPDGRAFAYVTEQEPPNKAAIAAGHDYFEVGDDPFLTTAAPQPLRLWTVDADGGRARQITTGSWSIATPDTSVPLSWSPDGHDIVLASVPTPHTGDGNFSTIVIVNTATGSIRKLTHHTQNELYPEFSPDGRQVAYWYPIGGDYLNQRKAMVAPSSGGNGVVATTALDIDVNGVRWMPDSRSLLIGGAEGTRVSLWVQPLGGAARKLDLGDVNPYNDYWVDMTVAKDGAIAFAGGEPKRPTELYYMRSPSSPLRRLTNFNARTTALDMGATETVTWRGPDGFTEDGVLTYPVGFVRGKRYPLVVHIHGGPDIASTTEFWDWLQILAGRGYLVFQPNYRGSDGLGNAYQRAIFNDVASGGGKDIMAGIAAVEKKGIVDTSRIAVGGWSYGGTMTSWLIGHYAIWKAAVLGAAYMNGVEDHDLSDSNVSDVVYWRGSPWTGDHMRDYEQQSPISWWKNITTPTLILSNAADVRVPITQSYAMYHALQDNHVPVKFIAWPHPGHEPAGPVSWEDRDQLWLDWLSTYLK